MRKLLFFFLVFCNSLFAQKVLLDDDFNDNSNNWLVKNTEEYNSYIKNGKFVIDVKAEKAFWFYQKLPFVPDTIDFEMEAVITQVESEGNYGYGVVWGLYSDGSNFKYFLVSKNKYTKVSHYYSEEYHEKLKWTLDESINPMGRANVFKVVKKGNLVEHFINGKSVNLSGDYRYHGSKFGIYVGHKMKVEVDKIKITTYPTRIKIAENLEVSGEKIKLSSAINTDNCEELSPITSTDENILYCVRKNCKDNSIANDDVWVSYKDKEGNWSTLQRLPGTINNSGNNFVVTLSPDDNSLFIANTYKPDGTSKGQGISVSNLTEEGWELPKEIVIDGFENKNKYVAYCVSPDNKTLLLSIENKEGYGEKDLFVSFKKGDGTWSHPKNLGLQINTVLDETKPFLASDGKTLYFSSRGHPTYGYYDVFVSKRLDDTWTNWSEPLNLGPTINTSGSELGYHINAKGDKAYISSGGDIYVIDNPVKPEAVTIVKGKVYNQKTNAPISANIKYSNLMNDEELGIAISNPTTGEYKIALPKGKAYSFLAEKENFYSITENIDLTNLDEYQEVNKDLYLSPVEVGQTVRLNNIFFIFGKADLKEESKFELDRLYSVLHSSPSLKIVIQGHTDNIGSPEFNQKLSEDRAKAVFDYLLSKGITEKQISYKGFGQDKPVKDNHTEQGRAYNRRVEFVVTEM
jgi:OOP family OmpA-OmpF porin